MPLVSDLTMSVAYTFPMGIRIGGLYDHAKEDQRPIAGGPKKSIARDAWFVPITYDFGPHQVGVGYGQANNLRGDSGVVGLAAGKDTGAALASVWYQYALSRRTSLYAFYSRFRNDRFAGYDFFSTAGSNASFGAGADPQSIQLGIVHAF